MSAPKIQADYDGLSEIAKHFAVKAQDTNNLIQTVQRCVDELQRGAWIGKGASQFYAEMHNVVSPAMQRLRSALDDASSATSRIAQALQQHEREAGILFSGADGGVAGAVGAAVGAALGVAGAGGVLGGVRNFFRDLIQGGRDARDGFTKAVNKALGTGLGVAFDKLIAPRLVDRAISSSLLSRAGISNFVKNGSATFKKALSGIGGGVLGGAVDLVFAYINGTPIDGNMVFDQLVSGGIQGAIGMTGVGGAILLADAGIQIIGHGAAQLAANNADWLSYGNQARAESIRQTAERFSTALDNLSLDNRIDGIVGAIRSGVQQGDFLAAVGGVANEVGRFAVGGVGGTVVEGATLAWHTSAGLVQRASSAVSGFVSSAGNAIGNVWRSLW